MDRKRRRKRSEARAAAARRGNAARRKNQPEGNPRITNQRLTLPPGFLAKGFHSSTVEKSAVGDNLRAEDRCIFEEDLCGLLRRNQRPQRRSERIFNRSLNVNADTASGYFRSVLNAEKTPLPPLNRDLESPHASSHQSKSIFKEINQRFSRNLPVDHRQPPAGCNSNFCLNLSQRIKARFKRDSLAEANAKISKEIEKINRILTGKPDMSMEVSSVQKTEIVDENIDNKVFKFVPKAEWVFQTPPRQRIVLPKAEACQIQPAVICTSRKSLNIYELKSKVNMDFNKYETKNVPIDTRFLTRVDSFTTGRNNPNVAREENMDCEPIFPENSEVESIYNNPFFKTLTCRPQKTVKRVSKIAAIQNQSNVFGMDMSIAETMQDFDKDFDVIDFNGDWGTPSALDVSRDAIFDFKKQLFKDDSSPEDGKIFKFSKKPKLFDFSNLKK